MIKGTPHLDSTKEKRPAQRNSAFTKFKYVSEGRNNRDGKSSIIRARTLVQQYAQSEVRVHRRTSAPPWLSLEPW